ncbi:MAG: hypothetical protein CM1200mP4_1270 [Rhodospirillaceae bacterium]|nr:MAG: hypothetical protein CM1200mP4_1270 [Rhodospirillaceae bacterium]
MTVVLSGGFSDAFGSIVVGMWLCGAFTMCTRAQKWTQEKIVYVLWLLMGPPRMKGPLGFFLNRLKFW